MNVCLQKKNIQTKLNGKFYDFDVKIHKSALSTLNSTNCANCIYIFIKKPFFSMMESCLKTSQTKHHQGLSGAHLIVLCDILCANTSMIL